MKKAVIYGRVSKKDTQDYGRQLADLNRYAKANKYQIVDSFTEKISGTKRVDQRHEYLRLMEFLKSNTDVKTILVTELSRFGRLGTRTKMEIEQLAEQGVNIYFQDRGLNSLDNNGKPNSDTLMIIGVLCDFAKKEIETLVQRIKSGLRYSVSNGGAGTGVVKPYGFKNVDKKLVIDPEESKVVKLMFDLYTKGMGCSQIAAHLNSEGIKTRYQKVFRDRKTKEGNEFSWSDGTITTILKNTIYKGKRNFGDDVIDIKPIVDPIIFDQVQVLMKNRNNRPINMIKNDNHLKGLIKCGKCGQPYYMHKRKDNHDSSYKCLSKKLVYSGKVKACDSPSISIDKLLNSLFVVANDLVYTNLNTKTSSQEISIDEKIKLKKIEIERLQGEAKKFEKKLDGLIDLLTDGTINKVLFNKKKHEYQSHFDKISNQISDSLSNLTQLQNNKKRPSQNYYTKEAFQNNIKEVIEQVNIYEAPLKHFTDTFPAKQEVLIMVEVKSTFDWIDDSPIIKHFMISRRSGTIAFPAFQKDSDFKGQISKGQFEIDFHCPLKDFKPMALHNHYIKKRGSNSKPPIYKPKKGAMVVGTFEMINGKYRKREKA